MAKTLAEIRSANQTKRPERTLTLCLAPDLVAEVQALIAELETVAIDDAMAEIDEEADAPKGPPLKTGERAEDRRPVEPPRAEEIRVRLRELLAEMAEWEGELRLRAVEDGVWRRWVNEHPAREEGEPGHKQDEEVTRGYCNADDLIADLGPYAFAWNGDPLDEGDWDTIAARTARPDKKRIATLVVAMHEQVMDIPKWGRSLSEILGKSAGAVPPVPPADPPASTSAGSPPSDTSTTPPTTD